MKCPPCCPSAAVRGAGPAGAAVGPGQDGDHVHALPGALQRPDSASPPLQGLWLREYHASTRQHPPPHQLSLPLQPVQPTGSRPRAVPALRLRG